MDKKLGKKGTPTSVFKSPEGRQRILDQYAKLLSGLDLAYHERYIETSYGSTYVLECGQPDRPPLLLFHGSTSNSAAWFADMKQLAQDFRVMAVDLIGDAGHSAETRLDMHTRAYAEWIKALLAGLGLERASLMGNSLGAWMCLKFASVYPEQADKLVLLAASGIAPVRLMFILRLILFSLRGGKGGDSITRMVYGKDQIPQAVIDYVQIMAENYSPYTGEVPVLPDSDIARLTMPVLYIAGEDDQLTNAPKCARRLKKLLPQPTIYVVKDTGHVIYNVLDKVIPFLKG